MPELPEVETIRRGLAATVSGAYINEVTVRERRLRWPLERNVEQHLRHSTIGAIERRGKYLLLGTDRGVLIVHLGMSGSLTVQSGNRAPQKHTHVEFVLGDGRCLRFTDPRRFGSIHWTDGDPLTHRLLKDLGPEPLGEDFSGEYLYARSRGRTVAIKNFIMDSGIVVGVGNIYASEALFAAGIHPLRQAGRIARVRFEKLAEAIQTVLTRAISAGGTTLRDYVDDKGTPGYFAIELDVYGNQGKACTGCGRPIRSRVIGQRNTYYCPNCQR